MIDGLNKYFQKTKTKRQKNIPEHRTKAFYKQIIGHLMIITK